jgi:hypothetical protein
MLVAGCEDDELTVIRDALFAGSASFPAGFALGGVCGVIAAARALRLLVERRPGRTVSAIGRRETECWLTRLGLRKFHARSSRHQFA